MSYLQSSTTAPPYSTPSIHVRAVAQPPSRWGVAAAYGAFLATVPSAAWRVLVVWGWLPGTAPLRSDIVTTSGVGYVYALSGVQLVTGFLAVGLASRWGIELFGRRLNCYVVLASAGLGALGATLLFTVSLTMELLSGARPDKGLVAGPAEVVMFLCYTPILFWGPLVAVAAVDYARRTRRRGARSPLVRRIA